MKRSISPFAFFALVVVFCCSGVSKSETVTVQVPDSVRSVTPPAPTLTSPGTFTPLKRLRFVVAIDQQADNIGDSVTENAKIISRWYLEVFGITDLADLRENTTIAYLGMDGRKLSPETVLTYFKEHPIKNDEALVFYYGGHGAYDWVTHTGGQFLAMSGGELSEYDVIRAANAPLTIMLIDACSSYRIPQLPQTTTKEFGSYQWSAETWATISANVRNLFLQHRGILVMRAASPGQYGWADIHGSWFSRALFEQLTLDKLTNSDMTWSSVYHATRASTRETFRRRKALAIEDFANVSGDTQAILTSEDQDPWINYGILKDPKSAAPYATFGKYRTDPVTGQSSQPIFVFYNINGMKGHSVDIRAFYFYEEDKPVFWGSSTYVAYSTSVDVLYDSQFGWAVIDSGAHTLKDFPINKHGVKIYIQHGKETIGTSGYYSFSK